MKKLVYISFLLLLFTSCKPTSNIITSKEEAVKKGVYSQPIASVKPEEKINRPKKVNTNNMLSVRQKQQLIAQKKLTRNQCQ